MRGGAGIAVLSMLLPALACAEMTPIPPARQNFLLSCGGCHGLDGVSNSQVVPDLKDQVGYFVNLPEGRRYLARLPNVAFSTNTDQELAELLNYAVFTLGGSSVPKGANALYGARGGGTQEAASDRGRLVQLPPDDGGDADRRLSRDTPRSAAMART